MHAIKVSDHHIIPDCVTIEFCPKLNEKVFCERFFEGLPRKMMVQASISQEKSSFSILGPRWHYQNIEHKRLKHILIAFLSCEID